VLTTKNYVRTCTKINGDWLLQIAPEYYDLANFPDCEALTALKRIMNRKRNKGDKDRKGKKENQV
jgi:pre-mRNA-splicing factor ATP-dependent RNA helicase DHX15/PRP43